MDSRSATNGIITNIVGDKAEVLTRDLQFRISRNFSKPNCIYGTTKLVHDGVRLKIQPCKSDIHSIGSSFELLQSLKELRWKLKNGQYQYFEHRGICYSAMFIAAEIYKKTNYNNATDWGICFCKVAQTLISRYLNFGLLNSKIELLPLEMLTCISFACNHIYSNHQASVPILRTFLRAIKYPPAPVRSIKKWILTTSPDSSCN